MAHLALPPPPLYRLTSRRANPLSACRRYALHPPGRTLIQARQLTHRVPPTCPGPGPHSRAHRHGHPASSGPPRSGTPVVAGAAAAGRSNRHVAASPLLSLGRRGGGRRARAACRAGAFPRHGVQPGQRQGREKEVARLAWTQSPVDFQARQPVAPLVQVRLRPAWMCRIITRPGTPTSSSLPPPPLPPLPLPPLPLPLLPPLPLPPLPLPPLPLPLLPPLPLPPLPLPPLPLPPLPLPPPPCHCPHCPGFRAERAPGARRPLRLPPGRVPPPPGLPGTDARRPAGAPYLGPI